MKENYIDILFKACENDDINEFSRVIHRVRDINQLHENGWNFLIVAVYNHSYRIVDNLLEGGAEINATNHKGTSVFMYAKTKALKNRNFKFLQMLWSHGADILHADAYGKTVFDYVREVNDKEMLSFLNSLKDGS